MGDLRRLADKQVYLDTNIFIHILEGSTGHYEQMKLLLDLAHNKQADFFTSELTLAEVSVLPFRQQQHGLLAKYTQLLNDTRFVKLIPTTQNIYLKAGFYRATFNMKLPDAIHVASAVVAECEVLISNDRGIRTPQDLKLWLL